MEQPPQRPGGEQSPVNSYGTDDPIRQTEIEAARIAASQERRRNRARLEELVAQGANPDEAEAIIEYEHATEDRHTTPGDTSPEPPVTAENGERRRYQPWVYVADTSSQEQGLQHGQWLDAARTPDELCADIVALLARSPLPHATDWRVQASTGFAGLDLHGFVDTVLISELGRGVATHGAAYAAWVSIVGTQDHEHLARFTDFYLGSYDSLEAWRAASAKTSSGTPNWTRLSIRCSGRTCASTTRPSPTPLATVGTSCSDMTVSSMSSCAKANQREPPPRRPVATHAK
jgi:Antirestriction protein (ArdA)